LLFVGKLLNVLVNVLALFYDDSDELFVHIVDPEFELFEDFSCRNIFRVLHDLDQPALLGTIREILGVSDTSESNRNVFELLRDPLVQGLLLTVDMVSNAEQLERTFEDPSIRASSIFFAG
jgi:hypothetical protein